MAQDGEDGALDDLHGHFDLGLVAGLAHPRGDDGDAVVVGHVLISGVQIRFVTVGGGDSGFEVVGHEDVGHTAEEGKRTGVCTDPIGQRLG